MSEHHHSHVESDEEPYEPQGWEGDSDDDMQCNHEDGGMEHGHGHDDPLFQKPDWTLEDWIEFSGRTPQGKSKGKPTPKLIKYVKDILPTEPAKIIVPLCGKSPDLRWLYERGNTVIGIEGVEKLVSEFFTLHNDLSHSVEDCPFGKLYKTPDDRLKVYVCDIKKIPSNALGQFDAVFDWAAYSGIHKDDRQQYVKIMTSMLKENSRYFVEICHDGPPEGVFGPNCISLRELKLHFGPDMKMKFLETKDIAKGWGVDSFFNSFILMTRQMKK